MEHNSESGDPGNEQMIERDKRYDRDGRTIFVRPSNVIGSLDSLPYSLKDSEANLSLQKNYSRYADESATID